MKSKLVHIVQSKEGNNKRSDKMFRIYYSKILSCKRHNHLLVWLHLWRTLTNYESNDSNENTINHHPFPFITPFCTFCTSTTQKLLTNDLCGCKNTQKISFLWTLSNLDRNPAPGWFGYKQKTEQVGLTAMMHKFTLI